MTAELESVIHVLNKDWEGHSVEDVAKGILKNLDDIRSTMWRPIGPPLKVGGAFKTAFSSKTWYVAWIGREVDNGPELAWVVSEDSDYGCISPIQSSYWKWTVPVEQEEKTRNYRIKGEDGEYIKDDSGKFVTRQVTTRPGFERVLSSSIGMVPGDRITLRQDGQYFILAVFCRGVLMRNRQSGLIWSEENANIKKFYRDGWK